MNDTGAWLALAGLGAYHGLNPAMGWLFAVALGLQERKRSAVLKALPAIAIGHEASIAAVAAVIAMAQIFTAAELLRPLGAIGLVAFGVFKLVKPRSHPRWVGLRVGPRELVVWSFLMSSAHGAGLMLVPVLLGMPAPPEASDLPGVNFSLATVAQDAAAVTVHSASMLLVMGTIAVVVYERLGLDVLRKAWLNVDLLWSVAVIAAGVVTLFT
ncbi:MAG: hypothetical protein JO352_06405 [Chloroflexi bacterium]|nr:hypothetical protein [Chloroflexota bacterium]MBV9595597.1 hypothetical protein [Chloroflexota bacterium]